MSAAEKCLLPVHLQIPGREGGRREEGGGREGTVVTMCIVATTVIAGVFCN